MSSEVAFLEVRVGAQGVTEARNRLKELTEQSERAEKAAKKLADETERAEARKRKAAAESAAKADKLATTAAINDAKMRQKIVDDAAKAEAKKVAAAEKAAKQADKIATDRAIKEGIAAQKMADDVARAEARKATAAQAASRKLEAAVAANGQRQLAEVKKWLMTEEEALRESYLRRRRIIETQATGSQKQMLLAAQDYKYNQDLLTMRGSRLDSSQYGAKEADSAAASIKRLALQYFGLQAAISGVRKLIDVNREFDKLTAGLVTATGSAQAANDTFEVLQDFAAKTPFSLRETTDGFVKLVNYGLTPSERAMRAYGNTASALGKDLGMMIEAVADAQTGEFERLKEFGVKAKQEGDRVTFTFRGVSTTVNKTSKEIQEYLIALGETNFSDAMANRMDTLDGKLSNLGDAWDKTFREIGNSPIGDLIRDGVDTAIRALEALTEAMNSDIATGMSAGLRAFGIEARAAYEIVQGMLRGDSKRIDAAIQLADERQRQLVLDSKQREFDRENTKALEEYGLALDKNADKLANHEKSGEKRKEQAAKTRIQRDNTEFAQLVEKLRSEEDRIAASYFKRQELIERQTKKKPELREELSTANYRDYTEEMANTKAAKLREAQAKEIKDLEDSLRTKEDQARASHEKQMEWVTKNVDDEVRAEALRTSLLEKEIERRLAVEAEKERTISEKRNRKEAMFTPYQSEVEQIRNAERLKLDEYQKARDEDLISAEEHALLKYKLHRKTAQEIAEVDARNKEAIAGNSAALFGNLAQLARNMGGEQSGAYKALFAMSKAFSIAQATMSIATGAAKALELGWPEGLAAGLQVAAQGAGLLATITSSNYSGAYDAGGVIPAGRIGLVGERGPEFVRGPAVVTSRQQTAQIMSGQGQGAGQPMPITLINAPDTRGAYEFARSARGEMVFVNGIRRNAATIRQILGVAA